MMYSNLSRASRLLVTRAAAATGKRSVSSWVPMTALGARPSILALRFRQATTTPRAFSAAADSLMDILKREYDEEKENETTVMPDDLKELYQTIQKRDWKIVEEGATTRLFSTIDTRKVQLHFHCQDTVEDEAYEEEYEEGEEPPASFRFTVTVSKAGKSMVFVCLSKDAQCVIESINVTKTDVTELDNGVPPAEYQGPDFFELAEDLQEAFDGYLEKEIGIDQDMAAFVAMYADYKEQLEYVNFLDDTMGLLK